jgi:WD40 repeat protein
MNIQLTCCETHLQVLASSYSPDGTKVVSCSNDKTVRVWDGVSVVVAA